MKRAIGLLLFAVMSLAFAEVYEMTGKWNIHEWNGYKPYATVATEEEGVTHISNITSKHGAGFMSKRYFPAKSGDTLVFHALIKGKGKISMNMQCFLADTKVWTGIPKGVAGCQIPEDWQEIELVAPVVDMPKGMTSNIKVTFSLSTGAELFLKESNVAIEQGDIVGDVLFPRQFTVFSIGKPGEQIEFPFDSIPEELYGVKPVIVTLNNNTIEFKEWFETRVLRRNAVIYAEVNAPADTNYTIGAGADYFMAYYVNGEKVIDTMKSGDGADHPHFSSHKATVRLKKGKNIFAIHFQTGSGSRSSVSLGGPDDLRNLSSVLRISEEYESDDYEKNDKHFGNPQIFEGILTDGMEQKTKQALFEEGSALTSGKTYRLPSKAGEKYFGMGLRVCRFPNMGEIQMAIGSDLYLQLKRSEKYAKEINVSVYYQGKEQKGMRIPLESLPCDFLFAASATEFFVNASSLNTSKFYALNGKLDLTKLGEFKCEAVFNTKGAVVDEYKLGLAKREVRNNNIPMRLDLAPTFDPVKAGWKLIWHDEFDGEEVDWKNTWMNSPWAPDSPQTVANRKYATLKDGKLHVRCEWFDKQQDGTYKGHSVSLYTRKHFGYGYYEARVRFTKHPGWWGTFWMHNEGRNNQLGGGYEIDIFEDYSTRSGAAQVASNLHVTRGPNQNSYGAHIKLPGTLDDFYVVGCKWTPFEISIYLNGKLVKSTSQHSPLSSLTFDAVNHALSTTKNYVCVGGSVGQSGGKSKEEAVEEYIVDYVRAYEYPQDEAPKVEWTEKPKSCVKTGEQLRFAVDTKNEVETAYLFDNGFIVDYKTEKPFVFDIAIDKLHYADTRWNTSGRSGRMPVLDGYPHIFRVCVQDAKGNVGMTDALPVITDIQAGTPEKVFDIPGAIKATAFNKGGQNVCSYKQEKAPNTAQGTDVHSRKALHLREAGEYVSYTVNVKKAGKYKVRMTRQEFRREWETRALLIANGRYVGMLNGASNAPEATGEVTLEAGQQNIIVISAGTYGIQPIEFIFEE